MANQSDKKLQSSRTTSFRRKFGTFLRRERERIDLKLDDCPKRRAYQGQIERGERAPDLPYLLRLFMRFLHRGKSLPSSSHLRRLLILWALARVEALIESDDFRKHTLDDFKDEGIEKAFEDVWREYGVVLFDHLQNTLLSIFKVLESEPDRTEMTSVNQLPTLDLFPDAFKPLVVIVGGYTGDIHSEPDQVYQLFRQSQSLVNLHYLLRLKLDPETEIISDQLLLESSDIERAREVLGCNNLLVIGSPLVNAVSRELVLTKRLVFNFAYDAATYRWGEKKVYDRLIESGLFENSLSVQMLFRMLNIHQDDINLGNPEFVNSEISEADLLQIKDMLYEIRHNLIEDDGANNKDITDQFRPERIFSPLETKLRSCLSDSRHQPGIISLGENPWANLLRQENPHHPMYSVISVSGVNLLSTTLAVKALSHREDFLDRPLGGLLDTTEEPKYIGAKRIRESSYKWLTLPYSVEDILAKVDNAIDSFDKRSNAFTLFNDKVQLELYRNIVKRFIKQ